ncbi:PxxKW family cysteine-rich protein [Desulfovibrio sp. OttesenSCG-928-C06]|nr:PxxKW family cysteine-rich protein [Desulfovibrio sp. OttesenSCG-928-C06]
MAKKDTHNFDGATMTAEGMLYNGFICQPIDEKCEGCDRARPFEGQSYCYTYAQPATKWNLGRCNFATHVKAETKAQVKVNPLKASKRASKGK